MPAHSALRGLEVPIVIGCDTDPDRSSFVGPLPEAVQIVTTFSAARATVSAQAAGVQAFLAFAASPATADTSQLLPGIGDG